MLLLCSYILNSLLFLVLLRLSYQFHLPSTFLKPLIVSWSSKTLPKIFKTAFYKTYHSASTPTDSSGFQPDSFPNLYLSSISYLMFFTRSASIADPLFPMGENPQDLLRALPTTGQVNIPCSLQHIPILNSYLRSGWKSYITLANKI